MAGTRPPTWTETTIETAIDTLANLTSVQGRTITLADAGADVLWGWDDSGAVYDNFALADITTEGTPADGDFVLIYGAEGDLRKVDWANLPGAGGGISNVVEDTTPELGGTLESNNFDIHMEQFSADTSEAALRFQKSRNAAIGSHTVVQSGDHLGAVEFYGSDGTNFEVGALILAAVDGTPGNNDMPAHMSFWTTPDASATPVERIRIDQAGRVNIGSGAPFNTAFDTIPSFAVNVTPFSFAVHHFGASAFDPLISLGKSRNATVGSHTVVQSGDGLGSIYFSGSDGDEFVPGASITTACDGTPGDNDMPGRLMFGTTGDSGAFPTERMRINNLGQIITSGTAAINDGSNATGALQVHTTGSAGPTANVSLQSWNAGRPELIFCKNAGSTIGTHSAVSIFDSLGALRFFGSDGDQFIEGAVIVPFVSSTPGNNDMPTSIDFYATGDGSATPTKRMTIGHDGRVVATSGAIPHFWVYWTANSTTILASYNMTSIADTGVGDADGTIAVDFSSANWAGFVNTNDATNGWDAEEVQSSGFNARAAGTFGVLCATITDGGTAATSLTDPEQWQVMGMGVSA